MCGYTKEEYEFWLEEDKNSGNPLSNNFFGNHGKNVGVSCLQFQEERGRINDVFESLLNDNSLTLQLIQAAVERFVPS